MHRWLALLLFSSSVADAESEADRYPTAAVDRPLVLPNGMTAFDIGVVLPTYDVLQPDMTVERSHIGEYQYTTVDVRHDLRGVEVAAGATFGQLDSVHGGAAIQVGALPAVVGVTVAYYSSASVDYSFTETAAYTHRLLRLPSTFRLLGAASLSSTQLAYTSASGRSLSGGFNLQAIAQLAGHVSLLINPSVNIPIASSEILEADTTYDGVAQVLYAIPRWDFYAQYGMTDLADVRRQFAAVGVAYRF